MFTKQHYKAIAGIIKKVRQITFKRDDIDKYDVLCLITSNLWLYFQDDNPKFDRVQFVRDCSIASDNQDDIEGDIDKWLAEYNR